MAEDQAPLIFYCTECQQHIPPNHQCEHWKVTKKASMEAIKKSYLFSSETVLSAKTKYFASCVKCNDHIKENEIVDSNRWIGCDKCDTYMYTTHAQSCVSSNNHTFTDSFIKQIMSGLRSYKCKMAKKHYGYSTCPECSYTLRSECKTCNHTGKISINQFKKCANCDGTGGIQYAPNISYRSNVLCDICHGGKAVVSGTTEVDCSCRPDPPKVDYAKPIPIDQKKPIVITSLKGSPLCSNK
jgi:hypothetical protein